MFEAGDISALFLINFNVLKANLEDITAAESLIMPQPGGNCLNWVTGHIVASRDRILTLIDREPVLTKSQAVKYSRGSKPENPDGLEEFEEILKALNETQTRIMAGINSLSVERLTQADETKESEWQRQPLGDQLVFFHFHEAYHVGQTGLLRRLVGKEGAIK